MAEYKSYLHVERLDSPECEGLLDNDNIMVTAKIDGTNACVFWSDKFGQVVGGSRSRQLSEFSDNAGFYAWLQSECEEAVDLRRVVSEHPNWIVYGEWLGFAKFIGKIKTYDSVAKGHMYIFDVYDIETQSYLPDPEWREALRSYNLEPYYVELLAILNHPTYNDVVEVAKSNKFLLTHAENLGEGVVCKVPHYKDKWGHTVYGKVVLDEYKQRQGMPKKKNPVVREGLESDIVDYWVTDAELAKAKEKVCVILEMDEFDKKNGKAIGYYLEMVWSDLMTEMKAIVKQYKSPIIDFRLLRNAANTKARQYIGLI